MCGGPVGRHSVVQRDRSRSSYLVGCTAGRPPGFSLRRDGTTPRLSYSFNFRETDPTITVDYSEKPLFWRCSGPRLQQFECHPPPRRECHRRIRLPLPPDRDLLCSSFGRCCRGGSGSAKTCGSRPPSASRHRNAKPLICRSKAGRASRMAATAKSGRQVARSVRRTPGL